MYHDQTSMPQLSSCKLLPTKIAELLVLISLRLHALFDYLCCIYCYTCNSLFIPVLICGDVFETQTNC